jgi:hypothetical protein
MASLNVSTIPMRCSRLRMSPPKSSPRIFLDLIVNVIGRLAGILAQSIRRIAHMRASPSALGS